MSRFVDRPEDFTVYPAGVTPPPFTLLDPPQVEQEDTSGSVE